MQLQLAIIAQGDLGKPSSLPVWLACPIVSLFIMNTVVTSMSQCRWDCHGLPVEHEIDKKLGEARCKPDGACT